MVDNDSMVGQRAHFNDPLGVVFYFLLPAAVVCMLLALVTREEHWAFAAVWPACYCVVTVIRRGPAEDLVFQADRIQFEPSGVEIPYESIQALKFNDGIEHGDKTFFRPGKLDLVADDGFIFTGVSRDAGKVYQFLLSRAPSSGSRTVSARLTRHLDELLTTFDDDLVFSYEARPLIGNPKSPILRVALSLLLASLVLTSLALTVDERATGWAAGTGVWGVIFGIVGLLDRASRSRPSGMPKWIGSSLIVSPLGIAVDQGDLVGKMKWDEILKLECGIPLRSFQMSRAPKTAINVTIKGANFMILDLYDRPLAAIYERMRSYWDAGGQDNAGSAALDS